MGILNKFHGKNTVIKGGLRLEGMVTLKTTSANIPYAPFGICRVGCGVATAVVSTTLVKSDSWFSLTPIFRGVLNTNSCGVMVVNSISEGVSFAIGWNMGTSVPGIPVDICWEVRKVA